MAAVSGFLATLLFVLLSVFPIISVKSASAYALKSTAILAGANGLGFALYHSGKRSGPDFDIHP
jgi:hypothetical protein